MLCAKSCSSDKMVDVVTINVSQVSTTGSAELLAGGLMEYLILLVLGSICLRISSSGLVTCVDSSAERVS